MIVFRGRDKIKPNWCVKQVKQVPTLLPSNRVILLLATTEVIPVESFGGDRASIAGFKKKKKVCETSIWIQSIYYNFFPFGKKLCLFKIHILQQ